MKTYSTSFTQLDLASTGSLTDRTSCIRTFKKNLCNTTQELSGLLRLCHLTNLDE